MTIKGGYRGIVDADSKFLIARPSGKPGGFVLCPGKGMGSEKLFKRE